MRQVLLLGWVAMGLLAGLPGVGAAATKILRNHDLDPNNPRFGCVTGFERPGHSHSVSFDTFAVKFVADPADFPYRMQKVRVLACGGGKATWAIDLWRDTEDLKAGPNKNIFIGPFYRIDGKNVWNELDLSLQSDPDLIVTGGGIRIGLTYIQSAAPPGIGRDTSMVQMRRNFIREFTGQSADWFFAETVGVPEDLLIELEIETNVPLPTPTPVPPSTPQPLSTSTPVPP